MAKNHFSLGRMKKIVQGKVNFVILSDDLEVYSSNNFFEVIHYLDVIQRQNPQIEYKFTVKEIE